MNGISVIIKLIDTYFRQGLPCLFHLFTGMYCPGCGGTRAVKYLLHGQLLRSIQYHPVVIYTAAAVLLECGSFLLAKCRRNPRLYFGHTESVVFVGVGIVLLNWIVKNYWLLAKGIDLLP